MYKLFLTFRYLTRKKIVIFPILVVWLCVMMLIIVTSIMGGFVERVRSANRDLYGDIIISSPASSQGFAGYDELQKAIKDKFKDEIAASTPVVQAYSILYVPSVRRSVPALMIGVVPGSDERLAAASQPQKGSDPREKVTSYRQSLFEQYKSPMQAVDDLSEAKLPATKAQLVQFAHSRALALQDKFKLAADARDDYDMARRAGTTLVPPLNWAWLLGWIPLALVLFLLVMRARSRGWAFGNLFSAWRVILYTAVGLLLLAGVVAGSFFGLAAVASSGETGSHIALLTGVGGGAIIAALLTIALLLLWRTRHGPFYGTALLVLILGGALNIMGLLWPMLFNRGGDLVYDRFHQAQLAFDTAMRTHDKAMSLPEGTYSSREDLIKALLPKPAGFDVPAAARNQFDGDKLPPDGCIVGSQIGFLSRDSRGNFVHTYPSIYRRVTITVQPPSKSGNISLRANSAVSNDFTIVDDSHTGVYDVDSLNIYAPFDTVQIMAGMRPDPKVVALDPTASFDPRCHEILIRLTPKGQQDMRLMREKINDLTRDFADQFSLSHPEAFPYDLTVQTWDEKQARYLGAVQNEKNMMTFILLLMSGVVLVVIFLIFYQIVRDKTRDIGIIKAVGGSEYGVAGVFLTYGLLTGIVGGGLGVLSGVLFVHHTNEIHEMIFQLTGLVIWDRSVYLFDRIPDVVQFWDCVNYFGVALLAGIFGALIPAVLAAFEDPVKAVRYE